MIYKAFLFDLNGTMIDDMQYHIKAWHRILNNLGASDSYARMKEECYGTNNELLERIFPGRFSTEEKKRMSLEKEKEYQQQFKPHLQLIAGLDDFLRQSHDSGIKMAIGSAAIMFNIDFVLDNLNIRKYFGALVSADDVSNSKPHPETYLQCAERLKVESSSCLVFEDSPKGVESALIAGMRSVVLTTLHTKEEFSRFSNVEIFTKDYNNSMLFDLLY
ncbi:MAG: HAD family phosphatase [Chitinophagaceae bacterium]|nr:HAD family phosphatase [Chitinophagaceae bacterium]